MTSRSFEAILPIARAVFVCVAVAAFTASAAPPAVGRKVADRLRGDDATPFQRGLKEKLKERGNAGKKTPAVVEYEFEVSEVEDGMGWGPGTCDTPKRCPKKGFVVKAVGRTKVKFADPGEAHDGPGGGAKVKWPDVVFRHQKAVGTGGDYEPDPDPTAVTNYNEAWRAYAQERLGDPIGIQLWKGWDPDLPEDGLWAFGEEPREREITEEITFTFPGGEAQATAFLKYLTASTPAEKVAAQQLLVGFTYEGPNIDFTIGDKAEACLFGACATLWDVRAGFALDWKMGLRLPMSAQLSGPDTLVAGGTYDFLSTVGSTDWSAAQYQSAGVDTPGNQNEFVLELAFFAGAKVEILGANVCPICQYVDVNVNKSQTFPTPYGSVNFPIDPANVPIKSWDYGIVALALGLRLTPELGSRSVTAWHEGNKFFHNAGAGTSSGSVNVPVSACIAGGDRNQTITVDGYRYLFNKFILGVAATIDFEVFGYGVWNPVIPISDLDLSALGALADLDLGAHKTCNWAFDCWRTGPADALTVTAYVEDHSAPTTVLALAGTAGSNGWYVSNVNGTLTASDNPTGCGIGVANTYYGFDPAGLVSGTFFPMTTEGVRTVHFGSEDSDGNAEALNARVVKIDKTPPVISGAPTTAANAYGWYNTNVVVHFTAVDAVSGVASLTPDQTLSAEAANQSSTGTAVDHAGLSASYTVTGIHIDKTAPSVNLSSPAAVGYQNTGSFVVSWSASDSLSGIATETGLLDGSVALAQGQVMELVLVGGGNHTISAVAVDRADNVGSDAHTFLVDVDINGLLAAVNKTCELGWVRSNGPCKSLQAKILEAKASIDAGLKTDARGQLEAFINELYAQYLKGINQAAFDLLLVDAQYVITRYGL